MRPSRHPRRLLGLMVAVVLSAGLPSPAAAADPIELPGDSIAAVVVDLDGDHEREIVRLIRSPSEGVVIDAWRYGANGWDGIRGTLLVSNPAQGIAALIRTVHDEDDRLLAVTAEPIPGNEFGAVCCVSLAEVRHENGATSLTPVSADDLDGGASYLQSLDFDADGTDELVTMRTTFDDDGLPDASFFEVQAWRDGRYVQVGEVIGTDGNNSIQYGETDGVDGAELLIGPNEGGAIQRLALVDGELRIEEGHVDVPESDGEIGYMSAIAGELIVIVERTGVRTVSWPSGRDPRDVGVLDGLGEYPWITAVGTGSDAVLVHLGSFAFQRDQARGATIYDLDLRPIGDARPSPESEAIWRLLERGYEGNGIDVYPYPYLGPLPPELTGGRPSIAASGVLIAADGEGGYETRPMSPLAGLNPHGATGPEDGWLATSSGLWSSPPDAVYLSQGSADSLAAGRLILIPVESLWAPASRPASIELDGAVLDAAEERLISRPEGFSAVVDAPAGTLVFAGSTQLEAAEVGAEPLTVEFAPPSRSDERNTDFGYGLLAVMPDGRVMVEEWEGTVVRGGPSLEVVGTTTAFELGANLRGTVAPYADLLVDGRPVEVGADGAFEVSVDAPPWPRDVMVVARDPLGNETSARVQIIGFVDYRGLPWIPIVGLVTVLVGAYVFLRVPRRRVGPTPAWSGDGTLEEIELE